MDDLLQRHAARAATRPRAPAPAPTPSPAPGEDPIPGLLAAAHARPAQAAATFAAADAVADTMMPSN
eukprot:scaffold50001_cov18-Phaeocystis_antarctica.AAC.1